MELSRSPEKISRPEIQSISFVVWSTHIPGMKELIASRYSKENNQSPLTFEYKPVCNRGFYGRDLLSIDLQWLIMKVMTDISSILDLLTAYRNGRRHFDDLEIESDSLDLQNQILRDCIFEGCFLYLDFRGCDLRNSQFLGCNIKTADFRKCDLTHAVFRKCLVESVMFSGAKTDSLIFEENYFQGSTLTQDDFDKYFKNTGEHE